VIILEGPDGAGKTRLAQRLSEDLEIPIEPKVVSSEAQAMVPSLKRWVEDDLRSWPRVALYDRHRLISEPIYGPILRHTMERGFDDRLWLLHQLQRFRELEPSIVFCLPPPDVVWANVATDPDNWVVKKHIDKIYWLYQMETSRWPRAWVWDYTHELTDMNYKSMLTNLRHKEAMIMSGAKSVSK
jgi:hypothetical protein